MTSRIVLTILNAITLMINTGDLRRICKNSSVSLNNVRILIHCTSDERQYFSLSVDVFNFKNIYECQKLYTKKVFFTCIFQSSIVHLILYVNV